MARRRKKTLGQKMMPVFIILLGIIAVCIVILFKRDAIADKAKQVVAEKAAEQVIQQQTGTSVNISEMKKRMEPADAEEVDALMQKYSDDETISECADLYQNGGIDAVKQYMQTEVDPADVARLQELYQKYGDSLQ
ncbi:MAG: hypothetical protein Q4G60_02075 [bacterium]|nr:hypothetical protein [bacterium]